jgi:hypothetical protein
MVFYLGKKRKSIFKSNYNRIIEGPELKDFFGSAYSVGNNILNLIYGQFQALQNMEFISSSNASYVQTRRGSSLLKDIVTKAIGCGLFYDGTYKFNVWVDSGGTLKYYSIDSDTITNITTSLNTSDYYAFWMYQLGGNETLYYANPTQGFRKLTYSSGFTDAEVTDLSGVTINGFAYSNISGRFIVGSGHKILYSAVQNQTAADTTNLESFNSVTNFAWVQPDSGEGIQTVFDNGEITFLFKDTGIWALINAYEDPTNWLIPKTDADQGTRSPHTIQYCRYGQSEGFIYLASDKTLRFFNGSVERNSGTKPTLKGGSSKIISKDFQILLNNIPSSKLKSCTAKYFNRYYILSIFTESDSSSDLSIIIDTEKLLPLRKGESINQPYFWTSNDMLFDFFNIYDYDTLYGFNIQGYISELFVNNQYYDSIPSRVSPSTNFQDIITLTSSGIFNSGETVTGSLSGVTGTVDVFGTDIIYVNNASGEWTIGETITGNISGSTGVISEIERDKEIDWHGYLSWQKYASKESQFYDGYLYWETESRKSIKFTINSFLYGEAIPNYDDTIDTELTPSTVSGSYFDLDYFDLAYFDSSSSNQISQNLGLEKRGHYFSFGFKTNGFNSWAKIYGLESRFRIIRNDTMGKNI